MQQSPETLSFDAVLTLAERDSGAYGQADDGLKARVASLIDWICARGPYTAEQVDAMRRDEESCALEKARSIGYLLSVALRAIETGDLAARLEALETVLKLRNGERRG